MICGKSIDISYEVFFRVKGLKQYWEIKVIHDFKHFWR